MSLHITSNTAALSAYQNLSARTAELDAGLVSGQAPAAARPGGDTVELSTANRAAASSAGIPDADLAAQMMLLAAAQITANPLTALAAQANSSADATLALLR